MELQGNACFCQKWVFSAVLRSVFDEGITVFKGNVVVLIFFYALSGSEVILVCE